MKYDPKNHKALVVSSKGQHLVAEEIIRRAKEYGVEIKKNPNFIETL